MYVMLFKKKQNIVQLLVAYLRKTWIMPVKTLIIICVSGINGQCSILIKSKGIII